MKKRVTIGITLTLLLVSMLSLAFNIQPAKASGTIYIRADGSVEPSDASIQRNGDLYTLTGNISSDANGIIIERDNMTLDGAGYSLQGTGVMDYYGIDVSGRNNVTTKNIEIKAFWHGMRLKDSSSNSIVGNNITNNSYGVYLEYSSGNSIYHNDFIDNTYQAGVPTSEYANVWDDGYPSGGNYWSDYTGVDHYTGPYQNLTEGIGRDGIGDVPYAIDGTNVDHYPLMIPWTSQTSIHPSEGQYANYTIRLINPADETILHETRWNLTYHKYVSPFLMYVMTWIEDSYPELDWTALNITNRYAYHFNWPITGRMGDMWFPSWIETNITTGSTIKLLDGTATVVGDKIVEVNSRPIDCWELLHIEEHTLEHTFWYDKTTGLLIGQEIIGDSVKLNTTLVDTNIIQLTPPIPTSIDELETKVEELGSEDKIDNQGIVKSLIAKLNVAQKLVDKEKVDKAEMVLNDFIMQVQELSGIHITPEAADILIQSAEHIISEL